MSTKRKKLVRKKYNSNILVARENEFRNLHLSEVFRKTYQEKRWGDENGEFYSGPGSYGEITGVYVDFIVSYIQKNQIKSVVDLGCGDFNIGRQITQRLPEIKYTGVYIFEEIVQHNNSKYSSTNVSFYRIDTTKQ